MFGFLAIINLAFYLALLIYYAGFLPIKQDFIILSCLVC
ncbi:putative membrane protein [Moraxella catarrhalis BBH18]|nr:putative membrane protein [Moraxella catarrhalis BBH18]